MRPKFPAGTRKPRFKKYEAMEIVWKRVHESPCYPRDIYKDKESPLFQRVDTVKDDCRTFQKMGLFKKLDDGRYAWFEYNELEAKVKSAWQQCDKEQYVQVTLDYLAHKVRESPKRIRDLAYRLRPENITIGEENIKRTRIL